MTLTPLHPAFVWFLKPRFKWLSFAGLTIGSFIPDLEPLASFAMGLSVFCGWDFPCSLAPDRLVLHSIFGALTADIVLTMGAVLLIGNIGKVHKLGMHGFSRVKVITPGFAASAAIGSLSHVLIDWLHHPSNPVFWPLSIDGSYYVGGLLLPFFSVFHASLLIAIIAGAIMAATMVMALRRSGLSPWLLLVNPPAALSIVTVYLSREEERLPVNYS